MEHIKPTTEENLQKELVLIARKHKLKRKIITTAIILGLVILAIAAAWIYGQNQAKKNAEAEIAELAAIIAEKEQEIEELNNTPIVASPVAPEILLDIVYSKIENIAELATVEYLFTDAAKFSDSKQIKSWNIPFTEKSFIMRWDGVIKAGVDLNLVSIEVNEAAAEITVFVPKAEILSYEIDQNSIEILDEKDNIFNNISVEDKVKFDTETQKAMEERAIENGLLEKAQANAETILTGLIAYNAEIGDYYTITFQVTE